MRSEGERFTKMGLLEAFVKNIFSLYFSYSIYPAKMDDFSRLATLTISHRGMTKWGRPIYSQYSGTMTVTVKTATTTCSGYWRAMTSNRDIFEGGP